MVNGCYGLELLGQICRCRLHPVSSIDGSICSRTGRTAKAQEYLTQAVQVNPALWSAFQALCDLGAYTPSTHLIHERVDTGGGASAEQNSAVPSIQAAAQRLQAESTPGSTHAGFASGESPAGTLLFTPGASLTPPCVLSVCVRRLGRAIASKCHDTNGRWV